MKDKRRLTRIGFVADESFNYFITIFVTSTLLGYITSSLGFSDAEQGMISAITTLCLSAQLLAPLFVGRRVKRLVCVGMLIAHFSFFAIYILPLISNTKGEYGIIPLIMIFLLFLGNFINNALNSTRLVWLMKSVDNGKRGSFTAVKEMISLAGGIVLSLLVGVLADAFRDSDGSPKNDYYIICAIIIGILAILNAISLIISNEEKDEGLYLDRPKFDLLKVFRDNGIRKILLIDILWYFANGISTAFYASYLREDLEFNFTTITIITSVTSLCRFIASPLMGRLGDKFGFKTTMLLCFALNSIAFFAAMITFPGEMRWMYVVYAAFSGFALAGINSGLMNLVYDYIRPEDRSQTLGVKSALGGVVGFCATLLGGWLLASIQKAGGVCLFGKILSAQQILSAIAALTMIILVAYVKLVISKMKRVDI